MRSVEGPINPLLPALGASGGTSESVPRDSAVVYTALPSMEYPMLRRTFALLSVLSALACVGGKDDTADTVDTTDDTADDTGVANEAPTVTITLPAEGGAYSELEDLVFQATVSDDLDAPEDLILSWEDGDDLVLDTSAASADGTATFTLETPAPGGYSVTLTATDSEGLSGSATVTFTIGGAPGQAEVELLPAQPTTGDDLTATIVTEATDPEGDALTYRYAWTVDGEATDLTDATVSAGETTRGEVWAVQVFADDGLSEGLPATAEVTIVNSAPALGAVQITPTTAYATDTLSCGASPTDADGDALTPTYAWTIGGAQVGTSSTLSGVFAGGDVVTCTVSVDDGNGGAASGSASVTILNSAPVLSSVSLTPTTAYEGDTFTCTPGTTTDADGDSVSYSYAWTVSGLTSSVTASTLGSSYFDRDDTVFCTVTPSDGTSSGTAVDSNTVTVSNSAPTDPGIAITPGSPAESDDLLCGVTTPSTDADGDGVDYLISWSVNGVAWTGTTGTTTWVGDTISATETVDGDEWQCFATATDGIDSSNQVASSTVTVSGGFPLFDGFETGDFTALPWNSTSWRALTGTAYSGSYAARSNTITHNQTTSLSITVTMPSSGTVSFRHRTSSESGYDYLNFHVDGVRQNRWSGNASSWSFASFPLTAGTHTLQWSYSKDGSVNSYSDTVYVDDVTISVN